MLGMALVVIGAIVSLLGYSLFAVHILTTPHFDMSSSKVHEQLMMLLGGGTLFITGMLLTHSESIRIITHR